jgi:hypothetical protein
MMNLNDIRVEQELAQERYRDMIRDRELARLLRGKHNRARLYVRGRNWLGNQLINWGCRLKIECQAA